MIWLTGHKCTGFHQLNINRNVSSKLYQRIHTRQMKQQDLHIGSDKSEKFKMNESSVCLMLQIDTHEEKQTHKHMRTPISSSHRVPPMNHRHAWFNPLKQNQTHTHTQLLIQRKDHLIKWKAYACADGMKVIEEVLWPLNRFSEVPLSNTCKLQLSVVAPWCEYA